MPTNPGPIIDQSPSRGPNVPVDRRWNDSALKTKLEPAKFTNEGNFKTDAFDYAGKRGEK